MSIDSYKFQRRNYFAETYHFRLKNKFPYLPFFSCYINFFCIEDFYSKVLMVIVNCSLTARMSAQFFESCIKISWICKAKITH